MAIQFLIIAAGFILLILGGEGTVRGSVALAKRFEINPFVIGATVIAFGTSAPELAVTITASFSNAPGLALGNIIGSNIANTGLILGLAAIVGVIHIHKSLFRYELPMILLVLLSLVAFSWNGTISRLEGIILLSGMALLTYRTVSFAYKNKHHDKSNSGEKALSIPLSILFLLLGLAGLIGGGKLLVMGALVIAEFYAVPQWIIGVLVLALGTSLPEVFASVIAASKGQGDLAIGNVVGSNAFNVFLVLGSGATIKPISILTDIHFDLMILVLLTAIMVLWILFKKSLNRLSGILLLATYFIYIIFRITI
jgi:cation:H+ antiporter